MNVVLLVIDSLRSSSLTAVRTRRLATPFFERLGRETTSFRRAYATECWTLPSHASMFTGLLPSEHRAHFQTMALQPNIRTAAECLRDLGFHTEVVTRNFVFDGGIPGITRGFSHHRPIVAAHGTGQLTALFLALAKPRFRRHVRRTGFFHPLHRDNRRFLNSFARTLLPADGAALTYLLDAMHAQRRRGTPYFFFCNLYDVHAPYAPTDDSIIEPRESADCADQLLFPWVMSRLGGHAYLTPGFAMSRRGRAMLLRRYERAIELADAKLEAFYQAALSAGLLDDTLLIITSDHGEAFGDHGLYLHDASVYDTHLHVPLWIRHPQHQPRAIDDVVSLRQLFPLIATAGEITTDTLLDEEHRARHPIAFAEHFHYPHAGRSAQRYRQDLACAISQTAKVVVRREGIWRYDRSEDPREEAPVPTTLREVAPTFSADGVSARAAHAAATRLGSWSCNPNV